MSAAHRADAVGKLDGVFDFMGQKGVPKVAPEATVPSDSRCNFKKISIANGTRTGTLRLEMAITILRIVRKNDNCAQSALK